MISPPISPFPLTFSLSAPTTTHSTTTPPTSSSFLFPPSPFTWATPLPDSPTPFNLMATTTASPASLTFSTLASLPSPGVVGGSASEGGGFHVTLPACMLPAAVAGVEVPPVGGRSTSQPFSPEKQDGRPSPTLASAITMGVPSSPLSGASSSHPPLLLSSFPPIATASASQPTPAVAPPSSSSASHSSPLHHPTLTLLRATFDTHTAITPAEQHRWQLLLTTSSTHHTRAQAEVGRLYEHFDAIVRRLSGVYERRMDEEAEGGVGGGGLVGERVKGEALQGVRTIAEKFVTSRQAVLHLHLYQSAAAGTSHPPRSTSSRSSSSSSSSSASTSPSTSPSPPASSSPPPPSTRPMRKAKRVVNPLPPNSTSTKRSYFHKQSTAPLKAWLAANMSDPYPSSDVKSELSGVSGLTYEQVQHWFINARMRVWRPMLRRQKEEQERRAREQEQAQQRQQGVGGMAGLVGSERVSMDAEEAEGDSGSECEPGVKDEESARKVHEWKAHSAEMLPRLP